MIKTTFVQNILLLWLKNTKKKSQKSSVSFHILPGTLAPSVILCQLLSWSPFPLFGWRNLRIAFNYYISVLLLNTWSHQWTNERNCVKIYLTLIFWSRKIRAPKHWVQKFAQNQVNNSWDIADIYECFQDILCCLDKCNCDGWHLIKMVQGTYL